MKDHQLPKKRKGFILLVVALLVLVSLGLGLWQTAQASKLNAAQATASAGAYQTTTVRRGDIALSVAGTGEVVTTQSIDLGFSASGTIAELNVQVGDQVTKGQVLAVLGGIEKLKQNVQDQELAVRTAQKTLDDLLANQAANLAQALADLSTAQANYADAKIHLHQKGDARCLPSLTQEYYFKYLYAQHRVDEWEGYLSDPDTGYGHDYILQKLAPMRAERDQAYANLEYCESYTDQEILSSQANLQLAKAKLEQANTIYENLKASSGIDAQELEIAQADLKNAQLQLTKAQKVLEGSTIIAPMDGTVMAVNGTVGQTVETGVLITLADLEHPQVQVNIDETDLSNFAAGCAAKVTFGSLPGKTFSGKVTLISPSLVAVQDVDMVQGLVDLEDGTMTSGKSLPPGLSASVEVTCQQATDTLLVPVEAVYEPEGQSAYVYVLNQQEQPEKRAVVVGIKTVASAEILSGLQEGERVITTQIESQ